MKFSYLYRRYFPKPTLRTIQNLEKKAKTYMDKGLLVRMRLTGFGGDRPCTKGRLQKRIYSGWFPRTIPQAESLDAALSKMGEKLVMQLMQVRMKIMPNRMSGRRACLGWLRSLSYQIQCTENRRYL